MVVVSVDLPKSKWKARPWFTQATWNRGLKRWEVRVYPGFVNGEDPTCNGYLPGEDQAKMLECRKLDMFDIPWIPIFSFGPVTAIPQALAALGAANDKSNVTINLEKEQISIDQTQRVPDAGAPKRRWIQQCQLYISVARATYKMDATVQGNLLTGQIVDYTVTYDMQELNRLGDRARLMSAAKALDNQTATLNDRLSGAYGDSGEDRLLIATIYFVSPPEPGFTSEMAALSPDEKWRAYVQHNCGWNLCHAAKNDPPKNVSQIGAPSIALLGRYTIVPQATMGALEAEMQRQLVAILNETSNEGRFWGI